MYTVNISYNNYDKKACRKDVTFNLDGREVFSMLPQLKKVFDWMESNRTEEPRNLSLEEISEFYDSFEAILLSAYGEKSEDGEHFRKISLKYDFEESAAFNACMVMFVLKPEETGKLLEGIMPMDLFKMLNDASGTLPDATPDDRDAEIVRLRAKLLEQENPTPSA